MVQTFSHRRAPFAACLRDVLRDVTEQLRLLKAASFFLCLFWVALIAKTLDFGLF